MYEYNLTLLFRLSCPLTLAGRSLCSCVGLLGRLPRCPLEGVDSSAEPGLLDNGSRIREADQLWHQECSWYPVEVREGFLGVGEQGLQSTIKYNIIKYNIKYVKLNVVGGARICDLTGCQSVHYPLCHTNRLINMFLVNINYYKICETVSSQRGLNSWPNGLQNSAVPIVPLKQIGQYVYREQEIYEQALPGGVLCIQVRYQASQRVSREQVGLYLPLLEKHRRDVVTARKKKVEF